MEYQHQQAYPQRFSQCDSYFVETEDDGIYARRAEERERQRAIGRLRQRALGEELSTIMAEEYQEDILDHMEQMEVRAARSMALSSSSHLT
jgi:hypothetical protein